MGASLMRPSARRYCTACDLPLQNEFAYTLHKMTPLHVQNEKKRRYRNYLIYFAVVIAILAIWSFWFFYGSFSITIYTNDCKRYRVSLKNSITVREFAHKVEEITGIPYSSLRLVSNNQHALIRLSRTLKSYDVGSDSIIYVIGKNDKLSAKYDSKDFRAICLFEKNIQIRDRELDTLIAKADDLVKKVKDKDATCQSLEQLKPEIGSFDKFFMDKMHRILMWYPRERAASRKSISVMEPITASVVKIDNLTDRIKSFCQ